MDPIKTIKKKIEYNKSEDRKYRDYWYSCKVDELSIMIESGRGETVSGNMFALLKETQTDPQWAGYKVFFIVTDKTRAEAGKKIEAYGFRNVKLVDRMSDEYLKLLATCRCFFTDNTYPTIFCKKKDQILVNTWHGTPLKHMGKANLEGARGLSNVQRNFFMSDYALFPNEFTRDIFMDDYLLRTQFSGRQLLLDYPRNDAFHDDEMRKRVRAEQGMDGMRVYAYMPTWRGGDAKNVSMEEQVAEVEGYLAQLDGQLADDQLLYVNLHPFVGSKLTYDRYKHIRQFPKQYETYDFLNAADALITDYSSVFFDFAETGRSIILFAYDLEDYMSTRGTYMDIEDLPFTICRTPDEVIRALNEDDSKASKEFLDTYCAFRSEGVRCADTLLRIAVKGEDGGNFDNCSVVGPSYQDRKKVHVIAMSELDKGIPEIVRNSIDRHLSEGYHVTVAFDGGIKPGTVGSLRELETLGDVDFYSLIGGVRDEDMPREVRRVFPGWHIDSMETIKGIRRNYYRLARHLIPVRSYKLSDKGDSIAISFRQNRLSYLESAKMGEFEYGLDRKGEKYTINIPKEDLSQYLYRNQITAVDEFGNEHKIISSSKLLKILQIAHTKVIKVAMNSRTVDDEQDNSNDSKGIICYLQEYLGRTDLLVRPSNYTDRLSQRIMIGIAYILAPLRKGGTTPIILYEKNSERYEESASVLYEKLLDMGYRNVYYVIRKDCPAWNAVPDRYRSNLLAKYSFRHYLKLFRTKTCFATERITHNIDLRPLSPFLRYWLKHAGFNYVFLQHGVMYMVSLDAERRAFFRLRSREGYINRIVVSSELEADHFVYRGNFDREELYVCGLLKFDKAVRNDEHDRIVIMPTWRPGEAIQAAEDFRETSYYKFIEKIYNAVPDELKDKVIVLPHPLIKKSAVDAMEASGETGGLMSLMLPDFTHEEVLRMTDTLITDYSSISYDAFYRGANVIFDWEEKDDTIAYYGQSARLMLTEDLAFGEVTYTQDELRKAISKVYGKEQEDRFVDRFRRIVTYHDGRNTERFIEMAKKDGLL